MPAIPHSDWQKGNHPSYIPAEAINMIPPKNYSKNLGQFLREHATSMGEDRDSLWDEEEIQTWDNLHESAEILDSLPKAKDGSIISWGRWAIVLYEDKEHGGNSYYMSLKITSISFHTEFEFVATELSDEETATLLRDYEILSTHRTKDDAEKAIQELKNEKSD